MITATNIQIGTLIHGTLRNEDLLQAFSDELARIDLARFEEVIKHDAHLFAESANLTIDGIVEGLGQHVDDVINDLMDALNEYAPAHAYFGTLEGDASDFGFWPDTDSFEGCEKHVMETPSPLHGDSEWYDLDCGVIVQVNDHGNVTVSQPYCDIRKHNPRGTNLCKLGVCVIAGHEIWSAV
jgi:hypothetical protein